MSMEKLGSWAFIVGLVIAIVFGFVSPGSTMVWVLALLGLVVGLLNVTGDETNHFLVASIAFLVSASSMSVALPLAAVSNIMSNVVVFVGPGAAVVAIKSLYGISKSK